MAAQMGLNTRQKLILVKGFGNVIIRPQLQTMYNVFAVAQSGDEDDRGLGKFAQLAA